MSTQFPYIILQKTQLNPELFKHPTEWLNILNHTGLNSVIAGIIQIEYFTPDEVRDEIQDVFCRKLNPYQWYFNIPNIRVFENYLASGENNHPEMERLFIEHYNYNHPPEKWLYSISELSHLHREFSHSPKRVNIRRCSLSIQKSANEYNAYVRELYDYILRWFKGTTGNHHILMSARDNGYLMCPNLKENADGSIMIQFANNPVEVHESHISSQNPYFE